MTKTSTKWTLRDAMRLSHPKGVDPAVGEFILRGNITEDAPAILGGFKAMQNASSVKEVLAILAEHKNLPWETIPTQFLREPKVWKALFANNALNGQALVRNVTRLARIGAFKDMQFAADYAARLTDERMIERTRLHPLNYLNALVVHKDGQIDRRGGYGYWGGYRNKDWTTSSVIAGALEDGFYKAFKYVEPAGKATLVSLDVSGSMSATASGLDLTCAQVAAAMAMTVVRTEPAHMVMGFSTTYVDLGISKSDSLDSVLRKTSRSFGGTDIAQPAIWAKSNGVKVETFVTITDNETWAGRTKPFQALKAYRDATNIPARQIVVGLNSTDFTVADPKDALSLDIVGGDANLPRLIAEFSAGRI